MQIHVFSRMEWCRYISTKKGCIYVGRMDQYLINFLCAEIYGISIHKNNDIKSVDMRSDFLESQYEDSIHLLFETVQRVLKTFRTVDYFAKMLHLKILCIGSKKRKIRRYCIR